MADEVDHAAEKEEINPADAIRHARAGGPVGRWLRPLGAVCGATTSRAMSSGGAVLNAGMRIAKSGV